MATENPAEPGWVPAMPQASPVGLQRRQAARSRLHLRQPPLQSGGRPGPVGAEVGCCAGS